MNFFEKRLDTEKNNSVRIWTANHEFAGTYIGTEEDVFVLQKEDREGTHLDGKIYIKKEAVVAVRVFNPFK